jgi:hypothetical protein
MVGQRVGAVHPLLRTQYPFVHLRRHQSTAGEVRLEESLVTTKLDERSRG